MAKRWIIIAFIIWLIVLSTSSQCGMYSDIYNAVKPSVVVVIANNSQNVILSQGTGFFIDNLGNIITNLHVINGSSQVNVTTADGHTYPVKNVLSKDISSDLVCLSIDIPSQLVFPVRLSVTSPTAGDEISVIGYPEGPGKFVPSITRGIVSSIQNLNEYGEVIQVDAAVSPGASGSPLLNANYEVIGVITFGYRKGQRQNYAVSIKQVLKLINEISSAQNGKPISEWNLTLAEIFYATALDLGRKGEYNQSIYYLDKSIELNTKYADAWKNKGDVLGKQGKYNQSLEAYDEAIQLDPKFVWAWKNKGDVLGKQGKYDESLEAYNEAIQLDRNNSYLWDAKGWALAILGKYNDSLEAYDEAIQLNPNFALAWNGKGWALTNQDKYDEAIQAYDKAIQLDPNLVWAWKNKGDALGKQGKYDEAVQAFDKAIEINPQLAEAWYNKSAILKLLGRMTESDVAFAKAKELGHTG